MRPVIKYFLRQKMLVNLMTIFIVVVGSFIAYKMRRTAFPDVDIGYITISTEYKGASALEVEQLVTDKIEDAIESIDGIKHYYSTSIQNHSEIFIEVETDSDTTKVVEDIKNEINNINDLPDDAEDPVVRELNMQEKPLLSVAIWGTDELTLRNYADLLEEKLEQITGISNVIKSGYRDREYHVDVDPEKLEKNRITIADVVNAIENSSHNIPSGEIKGKDKELLIRTIGEAKTIKEVEDIVLRVNDEGKAVKIKDVANVFDSFEDPLITFRADGHPALVLDIKMKKSGDAININKDVWKVLNEFKKTHPDIHFTKGQDYSFFVKRRLKVLKSNAILGLIFVISLLLIFLNWRIAICAALGIPVSFLGSMFILKGLDMSINMLSMLGLILVLGMLVDDAIVVAENIFQKLEAGYPKYKAALEGTMEVISPVTGTILTTMAAFLPLLLMTGIMGKFMRVVPVVILSSLTVSWLECMFILPSHIVELAGNKIIKPKFNWFNYAKKIYEKILQISLKIRYIVILFLIILLAFSLLLVIREKDNFKMFPGQLIDTIFMRVEAYEGTSREKMELILKKIEKTLLEIMNEKVEIKGGKKIPLEIRSIIIKHGSSQESTLDSYGGIGDEYAFGRIELTGQKFREKKGLRMADELMNIFRKRLKNIQGIKEITFESNNPGPPEGKPVAIEIKGKKFENITYVAKKIENFLKAIPKAKLIDKKTKRAIELPVVYDIKNEIASKKDEISVVVDKKRAKEAGVDIFSIASTIRQAFTGKKAATINLNGEEIEIIVRFNEKARQIVDNLYKIKVPNKKGIRIPITTIAKIKTTKGYSTIRHRDGKRVTYITAEVTNRVIKPVGIKRIIKQTFINPNKQYKESIIEKIAKMLMPKNVILKYPKVKDFKKPKDVEISFGGELELTKEAMESLKSVSVAALLLIFFIIAVTFNSLRLPLLVMAAIPFGAIGIILAFYLHHQPYSFLMLIGAIGMTGVVVNDSIVLVDFIKRKRENGEDPHFSIVKAGTERLRPVILTSVTTLGGLAPTAYQIGTGDPFLVPIALAIGWGLAFSTILTLIAIPCLYKVMDDIFGPYPRVKKEEELF